MNGTIICTIHVKNDQKGSKYTTAFCANEILSPLATNLKMLCMYASSLDHFADQSLLASLKVGVCLAINHRAKACDKAK